ncbi:MAG: hypothetical protein KGZ39_03235 [Simkania sp.]|nr:hypothetical protein [Simkania sp.]
MAKPYSIDLRQRVLQYLKEPNDKMQASQLFQVGIATVYRWVARKKQKGSIEPIKRKKGKPTVTIPNDKELARGTEHALRKVLEKA